VGKGSKAGDWGLRWVNADGDVSIGRRIRIREAGQSFPRSLNARGMGMRSWNRIWTKGSGFGAEGDGYHSASWPGHQLIYGYAQGTNWGWIRARPAEKGEILSLHRQKITI